MTADEKRADELETLALENAPMPDGLTSAEQLLFQKFRYLYAAAALGKISREQGKREKFYILEQFKHDTSDERRWRATTRMWSKIDWAGIRYRRNKTIENADAFQEAVYGCTFRTVQEG